MKIRQILYQTPTGGDFNANNVTSTVGTSKRYALLINFIGIISSDNIISLPLVLYSNKYNTCVFGREWILLVYTMQALSLSCLLVSRPLCPQYTGITLQTPTLALGTQYFNQGLLGGGSYLVDIWDLPPWIIVLRQSYWETVLIG